MHIRVDLYMCAFSAVLIRRLSRKGRQLGRGVGVAEPRTALPIGAASADSGILLNHALLSPDEDCIKCSLHQIPHRLGVRLLGLSRHNLENPS